MPESPPVLLPHQNASTMEQSSPLLLPKNPDLKSRLTVVSRMYFQKMYEQATMVDSTWSHPITSKSRINRIDLEPGEELMKVSFFPACYLVIQTAAKRFNVIPTKAELDKALSQVLEIRFNEKDEHPAILINPGESAEFTPAGESLFVRCRSGSIETVIHVIPK